MSRAQGEPTAVTVFLEGLELHPVLGRLATAAAPVGTVFGSGAVGDALRGRALGHALHPLLVQVPLGAMLSASVLDLLQGERAESQSRLLMGLTCLAVVPAAATGWAEWSHADDRTQRVGVVHAALNVTGAAASVMSYLVRRRGWSPVAAILTGLAGAAFGAGGLLGGHLSLVRKYASHDRPSDSEGVQSGQFRD